VGSSVGFRIVFKPASTDAGSVGQSSEPKCATSKTLVTTLPAGWTTCSIDQGQRHADARVGAGTVRYDALPGDEPILITRK
ncbi:MAG: hypothetical protein NTY19_00690, partial [Planctomycetota bacterium]|nr:hypothetical protein [Planctomycetota bacterium]